MAWQNPVAPCIMFYVQISKKHVMYRPSAKPHITQEIFVSNQNRDKSSNQQFVYLKQNQLTDLWRMHSAVGHTRVTFGRSCRMARWALTTDTGNVGLSMNATFSLNQIHCSLILQQLAAATASVGGCIITVCYSRTSRLASSYVCRVSCYFTIRFHQNLV